MKGYLRTAWAVLIAAIPLFSVHAESPASLQASAYSGAVKNTQQSIGTNFASSEANFEDENAEANSSASVYTSYGIQGIEGAAKSYNATGIDYSYYDNGAWANAGSEWHDTWTFHGKQAWAEGAATVGVRLSGSTYVRRQASASAYYSFLVSSQLCYYCGGLIMFASLSGNDAISQDLSGTIIFPYEIPLLITSQLWGDAGAPLRNGLDGSAGFDFLGTAILTRLDLPEGASLETASGTQYPIRQPTVPEPGTLALIGLGVAGLVASRRRKQ